MREAIAQAKMALAAGEVPVGAVVARGAAILGRGYNRREIEMDSTAHAELLAMRQAARALGGWRLTGCTLYVSLEPCPMCAGAIINARIPRLVYGAKDPKAGCCGSVTDLFALPFNHRPEVAGGCLEEECAGLLREFFAKLRGKGGIHESIQ